VERKIISSVEAKDKFTLTDAQIKRLFPGGYGSITLRQAVEACRERFGCLGHRNVYKWRLEVRREQRQRELQEREEQMLEVFTELGLNCAKWPVALESFQRMDRWRDARADQRGAAKHSRKVGRGARSAGRRPGSRAARGGSARVRGPGPRGAGGLSAEDTGRGREKKEQGGARKGSEGANGRNIGEARRETSRPAARPRDAAVFGAILWRAGSR
jgi:hypothetical protein